MYIKGKYIRIIDVMDKVKSKIGKFPVSVKKVEKILKEVLESELKKSS